jgi:hypothetical protein
MSKKSARSSAIDVHPISSVFDSLGSRIVTNSRAQGSMGWQLFAWPYAEALDSPPTLSGIRSGNVSVTVVIISVAALRLVAWIVGRIVIIEAEWPYRHNLRDVLAGSGPVEVPGLSG